MPQRNALITGITGQDGSYCAELLLEKGYRVYGLVRRTSTPSTSRIAHLLDKVEILTGDLTDEASLRKALISSHPKEVYNFAAQSHVGVSYLTGVATAEATGLGALKLFEAVRGGTSLSEGVRLYHASSSEMFGNSASHPQTESTPFSPVSPYGAAKAFAHYCANLYRESYGMFIACGIAFNHESERRGEEFVTRKITKAIAAIKAGTTSVLRLGNLDAQRDWLHAQDVVQAAWQMLQAGTPRDYIIASGIARSVQEFVDAAFNAAGLNSSEYVVSDPQLYRPCDIDHLVGNASRIHDDLGWLPTVSFDELVDRMVQHDLHVPTPLDTRHG